jgi:Icc-related predicted phosphoesterase
LFYWVRRHAAPHRAFTSLFSRGKFTHYHRAVAEPHSRSQLTGLCQNDGGQLTVVQQSSVLSLPSTFSFCGTFQSASSNMACEVGPPVVVHESHLHVQLTVPVDQPALRILCLSDTHDFQHAMPHALPDADILVHAGDMTCQGRREELANVEAWFGSLLAAGTVREIVCIAGNHELSFELAAKVPAVRSAQETMKASFVGRCHVHYLEDSACEVLGIRFYGSPWTIRPKSSRPWAFQLAESDDDQSLGGKFSAIPDRVDVLVTHQPPLGVGDGGDVGSHPGSAVLLRRVLQTRPRLHVFGHVHSGHGVHRLSESGTLFVNAAVCDDDYNPVQKPVLVEFVHAVPMA